MAQQIDKLSGSSPSAFSALAATKMLVFLALFSLLASPASCSFSLGDVVQDYWYYVDNHLAATTSSACLAAYNAEIDCDQTMLGIGGGSGSPNFNPGPDDLAATCTTTCSESLDAWVAGVESACTASGDGALLETSSRPRPTVPVAVIGEVFQYQYAFACSKDGSDWCWLTYPSSSNWAEVGFPCSDLCAVQFFENAHNYPGSNYTFLLYDLNPRSSWWENQWAEGYQHLLDCRNEGSSSTELATVSSTATATGFSETSSDSTLILTASSTSAAIVSTTSSINLVASSATTASSSLATTTSSSNAGLRLAPNLFRGIW
ncbi:hypothetical protein BX600DRAFT_517933 [Xylariales sp. PMI_506]|nr:hypothetical protein BX600DRAFT_517933 [Xylariales sp. PMI_506]